MIVVDSAHNRDSALKLRIALDDYFPAAGHAGLRGLGRQGH